MRTDDRPVDADPGNVNVPSANVVAVVTFAAVTGKRHALKRIVYSYSAAPTGGRLTVADGAGTVLDIDITAAGPGHLDFGSAPLRGETGNAMTITLAAGGAAVVGKLNTYKNTRAEP